MPISNMQQPRQMYEYGGLSAPRQNYGLGSFVKKAVRGVKKIAKSPLGKAALIGGGMYGLNKFGLGSGSFGKGFLTGDKAGLFTRIKSGDGFLGNVGNMFRQDGKAGNPLSYGRLGLGALGLASVAPLFMGGGDDEVEESVEQIDPRYQVQRAKNFYSGLGDKGVGLNFMPQKKYVNQNFYAADGGRAEFNTGGRIGLFLGGNIDGGYSESRTDSGGKQNTVSFGGGDGGNNNPPPVVVSGGQGDNKIPDPVEYGYSFNFRNIFPGGKPFSTYGPIVDEETEDEKSVTQNLAGLITNQPEYMNKINQTKDIAAKIAADNNLANGGRAGYANGMLVEDEEEFMRSGAGQSRRMPTAFLAMGGGAGEAQAEQMLQAEFIKYKNRGGELSFQQFVQAVMQQQEQGMQQPMMAANGGRMNYDEGGGIMDTEQAEMIDMGGMEKDYRDEGGFVAMGGEERADDVPARLSKNEFVFTADAVRNAGGGDIDRGSEVMQNLMDNLEQGGQVSEDSQGLGGGEEMMSEEMIQEPNGAQAMYEQQQALQSRMI